MYIVFIIIQSLPWVSVSAQALNFEIEFMRRVDMSFFKKFFSRKSSELSPAEDCEQDFRGLTRDEYEKFFLTCKSENNTYYVWSEFASEFKIKKNGKTIREIYSEDFERRNACISNNGTLVLQIHNTNKLETKIVIFPENGIKIEFKLKALAGETVISSDGSVGIVLTYRSKTIDSNKTIIFNPNTGEIVARKPATQYRDVIAAFEEAEKAERDSTP